ncbi:MAG: VCBS repeat-containing protein, partial [Bacteroidetes bacterium]|nr:VCBS repeat-containing protein [Bacteroidota bacterium]
MNKHAVVFFVAVLLTTLAGCSSDAEWVWQEEEGYRWAELNVSGKGAGFTTLSATKTGVGFVNTLDDESLLYNRHYMNGSGVAVGDVDGDGWADLYFARLDGPNVLYRNLGGWQFEDITDSAGVAAPDRPSTGAVLADLDGDGDLDLLVTAMGGPNAAFFNDGSGRFTEVTEEAGLTARTGSTTMALADVDGDGDLDLYVGNYKKRSVTDLYPPQRRIFERTVVRDGDTFSIVPEFQDHYTLKIQDDRLVRLEYAEPDRFYLNDGAGRFTPVSFTDGAFLDEDGQPLDSAPDNWALTVRFQDINGDGLPDLYVCNDFESPDHFWLGDGAGRFRAAPPLALRKTSLSTMSVDFSDIDHDGHLDFFLTDMLSRDYARRQTQVGLMLPMPTHVGEIDNRPQAVQNMLFLNRGDGTYAEMAAASGVEASEWSWSGLFLDVDLDGYEDLLVTTGHLYDVQDADAQQQEIMKASMLRNPDDYRQFLLDFPDLHLKNIAFRNQGDLRFEAVPDGWGFGAEPDISHGLAFGDFDHDGDLDAVVNRLNRVAGLYRNDASAPRLAVRLRGQAPNTQGIGATIRVTGGPVEQDRRAD